MFTPQQIDQISFSKSTFGGYNMQQVDEFLEPLTEDYVTLYKENALLKSKMRVLVGKLEEYRKNEAAMKEAVANAQRTCDKMVMEAEAKCNRMLSNANASAAAAAAGLYKNIRPVGRVAVREPGVCEDCVGVLAFVKPPLAVPRTVRGGDIFEENAGGGLLQISECC